MADENRDVLEDGLDGTSERKIHVVKVGDRIVKTTISEEQITNEGVVVRKDLEEVTALDCGHLENVGGRCPVCMRFFCSGCVSRFGTCFVCGGVACPTCSQSTILDREKKYHKACWLESIRRKIFG